MNVVRGGLCGGMEMQCVWKLCVDGVYCVSVL